jgi:Insect cuticle protein
MFGVVQGEYSYMDPKGNTIIVTYTADENGYKPKLKLIPAKRN